MSTPHRPGTSASPRRLPTIRTPSRPGTAVSQASSFRSRRPATADDAAALFLGTKTKHTKTFLKDAESSGATLPLPLPPGIPYVANFTTFEDLLERQILQVPSGNIVHLTMQDVRVLYEAKCLDQNLKPTWSREVRFMELLSAHCKGRFMSMQELGLGRTSAEAVAHVLSENSHYSVLDLGGNRLRDAGARAIAQLLEINEDIVHLSLCSNDIGYEGGCAIADALTRNCTVISLDLGGLSGINRNHLGSRGAEALGKMLSRNAVLSHLSLSSNGIGPDGVALLAEGLISNIALLQLNLASNNIGPKGCEVFASVLESTSLRRIDLQRNAIGDHGATKLAEALTSSQIVQHTVEEINLDGNDIEDAGFAAIGQLIKASPTLKVLSLAGNKLTTATQFAADLKDNSVLERLNLSQCSIREQDAAAIAAAVLHNKRLTHLDLSQNRVGDVGAKAFSDVLAGNRRLLVLNLGNNAISTTGAADIAKVLRATTTLQELNLRHNNISSDGGDLLDDELRRCFSILRLDVEFNDFTYKSLMGIRQTLERNQAKWDSEAVSRLNVQIGHLDAKQKELVHTQEEMDNERRVAKEKADHLLRRKEEGRHNTDRFNREKDDMGGKLSAAEGISQKATDALHTEQEKQYQRRQVMDQKEAGLNRRTEMEKEKKERIGRDCEKLRKQLRATLEAEVEVLKPYQRDLEKVEFEMESNKSDAKYQSESLSSLALKIKDLEQQLGIAAVTANPKVAAGSPAKAAKQQKAAVKPKK